MADIDFPSFDFEFSTPFLETDSSENGNHETRTGLDDGPKPAQSASLLTGLLASGLPARGAPRTIPLPGANASAPPLRAQQAGYLFLRAAQKKHADEADLDDLNRGQDVVDGVRIELSEGRANVKGDPEPGAARLRALRDVTLPAVGKKFTARGTAADTGIKAAVVKFFKTGNCGEYRRFTALKAGETMKPGETVHLVRHKKIDHHWIIRSRKRNSRTIAGKDVVMDTWCDGPAIFAEDGRFSTPGQATIDESIDIKSAKIVSDTARQVETHLHETTTPEQEVQKMLASGKKPHRRNWAPTPVLDQTKGRSVLDKLNAPKKLVADKKGIRPMTLLRRLNPFNKKVEDNKVDLRKEILAAGVARSLGANVSQSAEVAPSVVREASKLTGWKPKKG